MNANRSRRDHRLDFWRGLALAMIFIDHIPGNIFENVTLRNFGVSDNAEVFVFLSGFSASIAYFSKYMGGNPVFASVRVWQRTGKLYLAHIVTIMGAVALFFGAAIWFADPHWTKVNGLDLLLRDPVHALVGLSTLTFQVGYFNILPLYIVLLAATPLLMWIASRNLWTALALSLILYVAGKTFGWSLPNVPSEGYWFFDPIAWQLLFTIGFVAGTLYKAGQPVPFHRLAYAGAVAVLVAGFAIQRFSLYPADDALPLPTWLFTFDKNGLALPRLLHALALIYVVANLPFDWIDRKIMQSGATNPLARMGRHSLPVFCTGSLLAVVGQVLERESGGGLAVDVTLVGVGLLIHVGLAMWLDLWKEITAPRDAAKGATAGVPGAAASRST
ncbi:OpgC family protein [Segnochrobactrum spirostomi]|uniref:OpgC domain-containing protein n=1 Tax=Segnochrobactrum spirostomi TaxID=2608987 RepID=A0A6A7Y3Y2_9HYPH|nr:OpgC domain-containing protein [Segnochrobactrum spirostomi]MQT12462.1 OpgC domain-containing protein [Segnochrobactrum spirostomi]